MKIEIQELNFKLPISQREYVERRLTLALGSDSRHIARVSVWLSEIVSPCGQRSKRCLVQAEMSEGTMIVTENTEQDLYLAVHRAADRAGWTVARSLGRRKLQERSRQPAGRRRTDDRMRAAYLQHSG